MTGGEMFKWALLAFGATWVAFIAIQVECERQRARQAKKARAEEARLQLEERKRSRQYREEMRRLELLRVERWRNMAMRRPVRMSDKEPPVMSSNYEHHAALLRFRARPRHGPLADTVVPFGAIVYWSHRHFPDGHPEGLRAGNRFHAVRNNVRDVMYDTVSRQVGRRLRR